MNIVTVTCEMDMKLMITQAESISLFVKSPCTHWVIINDPKADLNLWESILRKYYKEHTLILKSYDHSTWPALNPHYDGYYFQQIFKLLISKDIQDDYLLLDSKNIFVQPINLEDFKDQHGSGLLINLQNSQYENLIPTLYFYAKKLKLDSESFNDLTESYTQFNILLPFIIKNSVMQNVNNLDEILQWFSQHSQNMNEFLLYSLLCKKYNFPLENFDNRLRPAYFWNNEDFFATDDITSKHVIGFHRNWIKHTSKKNIKRANNFLKSLGLTNILSKGNK